MELASFQKPPGLVLKVLKAVMLLLNEKEDWPTIKKLLRRKNDILRNLLQLDLKCIPRKTFWKLRREYLSDPDMEMKRVASVSKALVPLFNMIKTID